MVFTPSHCYQLLPEDAASPVHPCEILGYCISFPLTWFRTELGGTSSEITAGPSMPALPLVPGRLLSNCEKKQENGIFNWEKTKQNVRSLLQKTQQSSLQPG